MTYGGLLDDNGFLGGCGRGARRGERRDVKYRHGRGTFCIATNDVY